MKATSKTLGLTLVEIIVAIGVFSIIMLALSGTIVQGLQLRRNNSVDSQAIAYATSILEFQKNFWSSSSAFKLGTTTTPPTTPNGLKPATVTLSNCLNADGTDTTGPEVCALRRIRVQVFDLQNVPRADLITEIGNPER
jgi:type II secretory pathway pseudopilin PulG